MAMTPTRDMKASAQDGAESGLLKELARADEWMGDHPPSETDLDELFARLASDTFTAREAAEYLEVSMTTFRRYVTGGKLNPSSTVGRNQMFAVPELKAFKKALKATKG
jgi:hypothetical protein